MYIGPWQEYKLYNSKPRPSQLDADSSYMGGNSNLKAELQAAILSTLDADSAKKAIDAMNPLLDNMKDSNSNSANSNSSSSNSSYNPYNKPKRKIIQPINKSTFLGDDSSQSGGKSTPSSIPKLPSISAYNSSSSSSIYSARERERGRNSSTPTSVRSSQSEPSTIPIGIPTYGSNARKFLVKEPPNPNKALDLKIERMIDSLPPLPQNAADKQPAYNSNSMIHYLQVDRNAREKAKMAQYWMWSNATESKVKELQKASSTYSNSNSNSNGSNNNNSNNGKVSSIIDKKLEEVSKMKKNYLLKGDFCDTLDSEVESPREKSDERNFAIAKSKNSKDPSQSGRPAANASNEYSSPVIVDKELNQTDLKAVSKYFSKSEIDKFNSMKSAQAPVLSIRPGGAISPINTGSSTGLGLAPQQSGNPSSSFNNSSNSNDISNFNNNYNNINSSNKTPIISKKAPSPFSKNRGIHTPGADDMMSVGNPDNLINWAKELDLDDFA